MFDIDPPAPVPRLDTPRQAHFPAAQSAKQHLSRLAQADPWAVKHSVGAAIVRLRTLAEADGRFARGIDAL